MERDKALLLDMLLSASVSTFCESGTLFRTTCLRLSRS
jgi:hypothetical protein